MGFATASALRTKQRVSSSGMFAGGIPSDNGHALGLHRSDRTVSQRGHNGAPSWPTIGNNIPVSITSLSDPAAPRGCYVYFILVDHKIRYIGKGTNGRAWEHEREAICRNKKRDNGEKLKNDKFYNLLGAAIRNGAKIDVCVIKDGMSDKKAYSAEKKLILLLRSLIPLWNMKDGGTGFTREDVDKIWEDKRRPVSTPFGEFKSYIAAARVLNIPVATAGARARQGLAGWHYLDSRPPKGKRLLTRRGTVVTPIGEFKSTTAAARAHNMPGSTAYAWAFKQLNGWHFANEKNKPPRVLKNLYAAKGRPVITPQGKFSSISAAADAHGVTVTGAYARAKHQRFGWHFADEEAISPKKRTSHNARSVITSQGTFPSASSAAIAHGIPAHTAWVYAKKQINGFGFSDEEVRSQQTRGLKDYPRPCSSASHG